MKNEFKEHKIPKVIHYCWFGGSQKPKLAKRCINSWKKYCSDYDIKEWNEDNFDVNYNAYTKWCYENKKYAFLSDYVRLLVVYEHGGIYFDTDVELIRNPDFLLNDEAFFGFETDGTECFDLSKVQSNSISTCCYVASGLGFGSVAKGLALQIMLKEYEQLLDGKHRVVMCPKLNTSALEKLGLKRNGTFQKFSWGTVYPKDYFNPYESTTGNLIKTHNTISVHWYMGSCLSTKQKIRSLISRPLHRIFGVDFITKLKVRKNIWN